MREINRIEEAKRVAHGKTLLEALKAEEETAKKVEDSEKAYCNQ